MVDEERDEEPQQVEVSAEDEALLQEIRDRYQYAVKAWHEIREERQTDLRYICGDPWEPDDREARKNTGRPVINHDELGQYINQGVNNLRQNKRGIKAEPRGNGASDKTAELRQDIIRTIEYKSKAQSAYLRAGQDMYEGSYGFFRVSRRYTVANPGPDDPRAFDQEIVIKTIPNPDSVLYDPDCKEPDWSDAAWCFVVEPMATEEFRRRYPRAQKKDFTAEDMRVAKDWIQDKTVLVAEYWKVAVTERTLKLGGRRRQVEDKRVIQYLTNGVEILETIAQPGEEIPIPAMIGMERYVDEGQGPKRKLFSLPRLARDPQMSLAFLCSQEIEEAGMTPKTPVRGWKGQFEVDREAHETAHKIPRAFLEYDYPEWALERGIPLALPQRDQFVPNFQQYEIAKDSCRRAIQAAMGISPLPTAAQRQNEKSGIALDRIQTEQAVGSYHFVDGFDRALERAGRIIESWIKVVYDTEREEGLQKADDSRRVVRLNTAEPYQNPKGEMEHYPIGDEDHDIALSTGPSYTSQRDAVDAFLENLIANLGKLPIAPPAAAKLLALAIQMKDMGPKGDQMAEIISPTEGDQSQQMAGMQQHMQQQQAVLQEMQAELQKLQLERAGKVLDNQLKLQIEKMREENALAIAEVNTKAQQMSERLQTFSDMMQQFHSQAHDVGMQAEDQAHQRAMAQQQAQAAQQQQAAEAQQQQQSPQVQQ